MAADLFGYAPPRAPFVDIRNQRDGVAEEKATLCLQLGELCKKVPASVRNGDVKTVREWRYHCDEAKKTLANKRSSRTDLSSAIAQMRSYK